MELIHWSIYHGKTLGGTDKSATFFQVSSTSLYTTNMRLQGQLQQSNVFDVYGLRVSMLMDADIADVVAMMKGTLSLIVGSKSYTQIPLFWLSSGGGLHVSSEELATTTFGYGQFGEPSSKNLRVLKQPIRIASGEHFRVELNWPTAPGAKTVYVFLDGKLQRPL